MSDPKKQPPKPGKNTPPPIKEPERKQKPPVKEPDKKKKPVNDPIESQ